MQQGGRIRVVSSGVLFDVARHEDLWIQAGGSGYAVADGARRPLPIGSQLDARGRFTWNPGAGFVGAYDLVLNGRAVRIVVGR